MQAANPQDWRDLAEAATLARGFPEESLFGRNSAVPVETAGHVRLAASSVGNAATPALTVKLTQAELVYVLAPAGGHSFYEPAYLFSGTFQLNGATLVKRVLVPAVDPSQRTP